MKNLQQHRKSKKIIHDNDKINQFKFEALYDEENLFDEELMKLKKEMKLIDELRNGRYKGHMEMRNKWRIEKKMKIR